MTRAAVALAIVLVGARNLQAQTATAAPSPSPVWNLSASLYGYLLPQESDYLQPTFTADRGGLHLEARANYEAVRSGSAWIGWNFSFGTGVTFDITPMVGGVFGDLHGIAPGYRGALNWRWLDVSSEGEYVFATSDRDDWFFYNWSEVTVSPVEWLRAGIVAQRTRAYQSDREIQRGLLVGFSSTHVDITGHVFNPDDAEPTYVLTVGVTFSLPRRR